jgi:hypothetical protein
MFLLIQRPDCVLCRAGDWPAHLPWGSLQPHRVPRVPHRGPGAEPTGVVFPDVSYPKGPPKV